MKRILSRVNVSLLDSAMAFCCGLTVLYPQWLMCDRLGSQGGSAECWDI